MRSHAERLLSDRLSEQTAAVGTALLLGTRSGITDELRQHALQRLLNLANHPHDIAVLEAELRFQETKLASIRAEGGEPDDELLDLYSRVSNTQRLHLAALGYARVPRDVTPDIGSYLRTVATAVPEAAGAENAPPGTEVAPTSNGCASEAVSEAGPAISGASS